MSKANKLETVDINGVEIMATGTWQGANGEARITEKDLENMVSAFADLTGNKNLNYEPPVKLGHTEKQKLIQEDGLPAAGWIKSVKKVGGKLVADLKDVPKKIAELMQAGAYKKRSAEFYRNYEIGGRKYPIVLKALALLGADIPAVKTISDIKALYTSEALMDENGEPYEAVYFEESLNKRISMIREAFRKQFRPDDSLIPYEERPWIREIYQGYVIAEKGESLFKVTYTEADGNYIFDMANAQKVEMVYQPVTPSGEPEANDNQENLSEEVLMDKQLRELLGLDEKADVLEAVKGLKSAADAAANTLAEGEQLKSRVTKLEEDLAKSNQTIALKERDERVSKAISAGKILPAQKAWAEEYALKDPTGFDTFIAGAPVAVKLGEIGRQGNEPEDVELTEYELKIGELMGVDKETLAKSKKEEALNV
ncbi:MAG: phage protease [Dehalococcoidales bacterium]|nr:phage protease [Dehalococcoidales bacterium]